MKLNKLQRVGSIVLALVAVVSGVNSSVVAQQIPYEPGGRETAVSWPNDGRFLSDQINFELVLPGPLPKFEVAARPSQMTVLSIPVTGNPRMIRKYGILLHPEVAAGQAAKRHNELEGMDTTQLSFTMVIYCLEETPLESLGEPVSQADSQEMNACRPRDRENQLYDDARFLLRNVGIKLREEVQLGSIGITLLRYDFATGPWSGQQPLEQKCLDVAKIEVCSCRVASGSASVYAGCHP